MRGWKSHNLKLMLKVVVKGWGKMLETFITWYYLVLNSLSFFIMIWDKGSAVTNSWRVSERNLWLLGIIGGPFGLYAASRLTRHKTKKRNFRQGLPLLTAIHFLAISLLYYFRG